MLFYLLTNKHVGRESCVMIANSYRIESALTYKCLGVIIDEKLTWKEYCKLHPNMLV